MFACPMISMIRTLCFSSPLESHEYVCAVLQEDMYHENDYLPEEYHRHHRQSPLYATSATTNTPHETTSHFQTPMSAQGSGALGDGNGGTQISPEGPVQVFSSTRNSAATGLSSPESDGNLGVSQPAPRVYVRSNSNPDLQQPGTTGSAPAARPRPALARRSAAPALMQGPQPLEASPGLTVGVTNGPAAGALLFTSIDCPEKHVRLVLRK